MWQEDLGEGKREWRGKIQMVENGQVFYFRDWQTLIDELQTLLASANALFASAESQPAPPA